MKNLMIVVMLLVGIAAYGQEGQKSSLDWNTDLVTAVDKAVAQKKPLFLFFTGSDWCGWCKRLQAEVFYMPEFEKWAKDNVVLLELDFPRRTPQPDELRQQNMNIQRMFGVRGYPTVWFVNPSKEGTEINFAKIGSTGYVRGGAEAWIAEANRILTSPGNSGN